jgi:hypothetical protein
VKLEALSQNPMQEICMSGPSGMWNEAWLNQLGTARRKGRQQMQLSLPPPRRISTLPNRAVHFSLANGGNR